MTKADNFWLPPQSARTPDASLCADEKLTAFVELELARFGLERERAACGSTRLSRRAEG
jgi:hypothetical protein